MLRTPRALWATLPLLTTILTGPLFAQGTNIALERPYTVFPMPNYAHCAGGDALKKLTDGEYTPGVDSSIPGTTGTSIWTMDTTMGWAYVFAPTVTIDLGEDSPISGLSFSTAAGRANVTWPRYVFVQVSVDGKTWHSVGDLIELSNKVQPPADGEGRHRFTTEDLQVHGRYVRVIPIGKYYIFCDELEVYQGEQAWLEKPLPGEPTTLTGQEWARAKISAIRTLARVEKDAEVLASRLNEAKGVPSAQLKGWQGQIRELQQAAANVPIPDPKTFRAIIPLHSVHANLYGLFGALLKAEGYAPLHLWKKHRYDFIDLLERPTKGGAAAALAIELMSGEARADALLLTNATAAAQKRTITLKASPQLLKAATLSASLWTDTAEGTAVADALIPIPLEGGKGKLDLPAGVTTRLWLSVNAGELPPGAHQGSVDLGDGVEIPVSVRVSPVKIAKPRLSLGMWDYTEGLGAFGISPHNMEAALAALKAGYVDTPWADPGTLPIPKPEAFDEAGRLIEPLDFTRVNHWLDRWPEARNYAFFTNMPADFAGSKMDSDLFKAKVASWAKAVADHFEERGVAPSQVLILLQDEPREELHDRIVLSWTRAIKVGAPGLRIFSNPIWEDPTNVKYPEALAAPDILCPNLSQFGTANEKVRSLYTAKQGKGQELWFYLCDGPVRLIDPHRYYRLQAWTAFAFDAKGIGFWSFGDLGGSPSSWNEYIQAGVSYAPAFLSETEVTDSLHWSACREGMLDHEYLSMLRDAAAAATDPEAKVKAEALLAKAVDTVAKHVFTGIPWSDPVDRDAADRYRVEVLRMLEELHSTRTASTH